MTKKEADKLEKLLIDSIRNLDPKEAIDNTDPRYIDFMSVRGEEGAVVKHFDTIILNACKAGSKPKTYLFSGHNGSGKSTELKSIQKALIDKKLFTIKIDANEMLNLEDPNYIDILFSITSGIERHMDNAKMPLPNQTVAEIEKWSSETIYENATDSGKSMDLGAGLKMDSSIPFLGYVNGGTWYDVHPACRESKNSKMLWPGCKNPNLPVHDKILFQ